MKKIISLNIPKINIEQQSMFYVNDEPFEKRELGINVAKKTNNVLPLSFKEETNSNSVAKMSYKILGGKFAKYISIDNGLDFFFTYNKTNGYFDKKNIFIEEDEEISNISMEKFYAGVIDILKRRLVLGYLGSNVRTKNIEEYFRNAHKYIVCNKYGLTVSQTVNFVKQIVEKSFFPEEFVNGFLSELYKTVYKGEFSKGDMLKMDTMAKLSLLNEKKGKYIFFDKELHCKILKDIKNKEIEHTLNAIALMEAMQNIK